MKNSDRVILDIQGLKKYFFNNGRVNKAVDGVSFNVKEGEIVGLIGESGSGKTTVGKSLLRIYDDFNGFVTLEGKIISGKKIKSRRNKFMRKNIQMIFQDPHASLNGQKSIFNILKEPLVVNNIIKNKINDLFSDWKDVKSNFKYTFIRKAKKLKIQNLRSINDLAKDFFPKWTDNFTDFSFDWVNNSIEDNFVSYFAYLEEKQNMESKIINDMYSNTEELTSFYYQKQAMFRDSNLTDDEKQLIDATKNYEKTKALSKISINKYNALLRIKELEKQLEELQNKFNDDITATKSAYTNFIGEAKNDYKIANYSKMFTYDPEFYFFNYKKALIFKKKREYLKLWRKELRYLSVEELKNLIANLERYSELFFQEHLERIPLIKSDFRQVASFIVEQNYNFDYSKYLIINANTLREYEEEVLRVKKELKDCKTILKIKETPSATLEDVKKAEEIYIKAIEHKEIEDNNFAESIKADIRKLDKDINDQSFLYKNLKSQQTYTDKQFALINKQFFDKLQSDYKKAKAACDKKNKKEVQALQAFAKNISIYRNKIQNKLTTLKSFEIEVKYLIKDVQTIYLLLGIKKSKIDFISKLMISRLLTKSIIYKALEDVGLLKQFAYRYPHEFSGGQRQRIVIARALITEPKVIVADEPIASLDISIQAQVVNLLKDLCQKKNIGMVFIAHDLSMIEYIADRVQIMHLGKIVESGDTKAVYDRPMHPYTINLFKAIPKISNANEKFQNINFELDYLKEQQYPNVPKTYLVEPEHFLFGTKAQVEKWIAPFNLINPKLYSFLKSDNDNSQLPYDGKNHKCEDVEYTSVYNTNNE
ncbi:ATP-binding cassette domain-containing protein [Mycoplasmopsis felifaucium]|uniref:ATP-binding cassette domain-containing protein n=1 Tax=Mycoplasmopsis felifaucium TaxID=35768 RepID=A0ABZ2RY75_9BACT